MEKETILSQSRQPELNPNATFKNKVKFFLFSTCPMYFINRNSYYYSAAACHLGRKNNSDHTDYCSTGLFAALTGNPCSIQRGFFA
ncbi:hypothetical protein ACOSZF_13475 [Cytobacillus firmus]|uniref:hypothetical protein n=1 Tax=Cytobacillus firmus TaxID=1399 RepID=UPI00077C5C15|nr:hypothetical protein [Cytobacillus firmus]MBG9545111.1 hypothetical protein [Cytobacillus firmus]MBG9550966.1 hypothetical protein [Cytobacillus firmus]MBG9556041.1 hypothetical protein [Cytobacillus firmus]MBG9574395.1 hypothetical protein [Cytobacillus firmus]MBG9657659.1 hypothetical protein [Cytobacillus firmus]